MMKLLNVFSCPVVQDILLNQCRVTEKPVAVNKLRLVTALKLVAEELMNWGQRHHSRCSQ